LCDHLASRTIFCMAVVYYNLYAWCFTPFYPYLPAGDPGAWVGGLVTSQISVDVQRMVYLPLILRD
jgi:hypothetical protein